MEPIPRDHALLSYSSWPAVQMRVWHGPFNCMDCFVQQNLMIDKANGRHQPMPFPMMRQIAIEWSDKPTWFGSALKV